MRAVFADSFHFIALLNAKDPAHKRAAAEHGHKDQKIVTTDTILLEVGDALCHPRDRDDFLALYEFLQKDRRIKIIPAGARRSAFSRTSRQGLSLTGCISFVVMEDEEIHEALTGDQHFEQAGFKALLK